MERARTVERRWTLDGSEPTVTSKLYTKSFNVFDTTVVKAKAFRAGELPSVTASSRIVRLQTLARADSHVRFSTFQPFNFSTFQPFNFFKVTVDLP